MDAAGLYGRNEMLKKRRIQIAAICGPVFGVLLAAAALVGVGSFDDTGCFDDIELRGK